MKTRIFLFLTLGAFLAGCRNSATAPKRVRLNVEMSVSAGNRAALLENLLLLAEASRTEPGCIGYEIYENSRDSSRILIFETWRDAAVREETDLLLLSRGVERRGHTGGQCDQTDSFHRI